MRSTLQRAGEASRRGMALLAFGAVVGLACVPIMANGQVTVNYGAGQYGAYRRQLADFAGRASDLVDAIANVEIKSPYCSKADQLATSAELDKLRAQMDALRSEYTKFKNGIDDLVE